MFPSARNSSGFQSRQSKCPPRLHREVPAEGHFLQLSARPRERDTHLQSGSQSCHSRPRGCHMALAVVLEVANSGCLVVDQSLGKVEKPNPQSDLMRGY